ncbi:NAD(P)-dependent alcohol dehydrogenase [Tenggerimyces flavus]|uniref:NAD(P)-dependent alcohol dehydrogenase n=1 Tax=Tenggerimyces flavus TaxID=1708749 RepID=A0ABV7Y7S2_9ACTN|nr:NAD(P)-dependent alcohol dehydrogenase [Tenggerimyces flavus]MBM7788361.1 NADPH:quinone reductase-like Zn-dependent oxidoreductase [Tenggerimyces flavus]
MRAAIYARYGPPEVVRVAEVDRPRIGDGDVLVKVHAATVNRTDCGYRAARPGVIRIFTGLRRPRRPVLGTEFAGVVEALGDAVTTFAVGDRVFGYNENGGFGTHAEYVAVRATGMLANIPANLTFAQAAPATEGYHYALTALRTARVEAGQDVLVYGATGAIGSAAVQILKIQAVNVTAVCDTANVDVVRALGADQVVDYTVRDFTETDQRYDVVLDAVGKSTFKQCKKLLKPTGTYLSTDLGPWLQNLLLPLVTRVGGGKRVRFPMAPQPPELMAELRAHLESGRFRPVLDERTYPLDQIVDAYRYVESGRKIGNVVLTVGFDQTETLE